MAQDLELKRVLLVDNHQKPCEMRAHRLRAYGIVVDTAASIREAHLHWRNNRYDLVLLSARANPEDAIAFRREIKEQNPAQRVAFLVGPPKYVSFTYGENVVPMPARASHWADKLKGRLARA